MPHDERVRSRSPHGRSHKRERERRSRSPRDSRRHGRRQHDHHRSSRRNAQRDYDHLSRPVQASPSADDPPVPVTLPLSAQPLSKRDLESYRPVFASYLDIQKNKDIFELKDDEIKGRWKSFVGKWNRGDLAEGWYDPATKQRADAAWAEDEAYAAEQEAINATQSRTEHAPRADPNASSDSEESGYGPAQAPANYKAPVSSKSMGHALPTFADLADSREANVSEATLARQAERKAIRTEKKERMDELAPRAEPGTKERQLEKKRDAASAAREFRAARSGAGDMAKVGEAELMGAGGLAEAREMRAREEKKKTERQLRREEALLARQAEREERTAAMRDKEARTMDYLKSIAKQHWGSQS